jgi:histidine triad (HIT) family protein
LEVLDVTRDTIRDVPTSGPCLFCQIVERHQPAAIVLDHPDAVAFLDTAPVFVGHVLVVPRQHVVTLPDVDPVHVGPFFTQVQRIAAALPQALGCDGTWVSMNNRVSQSVPHLHVHVVPRVRKDGLRGFYWPRQRYADEAAMYETAVSIAAALAD